MPFAEINGVDLYYEIQGYGEPVLLLHHGFGCVRMWDKIVPRLVEHGYKTICYDRKGFGQSEFAGFEDFYVSDQVRPESLSELESLRHWLGIDSFHIVGQCEGGVVAADYASQYPHRVKSMVASSTLCHSTVPLTELNASKFTKIFDELDPDLKEKLISWHGERTERFFNQFRLYGGAYGRDFFDLRPTLTLVTCPALVLYPDRSYLFEVEQGIAFYRHLQLGELAVLPDCGHNTYEEQPEEYVSHITNFLARHRFGEKAGQVSKTFRPMTCAG
ncbi:MAG: alpha/beta hydrolase [Desulfomonile tiedjei]|uniref:Alpha/beta hydrolase n=1 Tax=Desulfomonile tiedjei TaxID=2358 RepID=A0A9D6V537_9BACT|nr:alpha/beta hydrolase [Desulfomonile tiedjei]